MVQMNRLFQLFPLTVGFVSGSPWVGCPGSVKDPWLRSARAVCPQVDVDSEDVQGVRAEQVRVGELA